MYTTKLKVIKNIKGSDCKEEEVKEWKKMIIREGEKVKVIIIIYL